MSGAHLRFPHIRGDLVTFVAGTEVWLASVEGGPARRLSHDGSPVAQPRLSPDGSKVAWTSSYPAGPSRKVPDGPEGEQHRVDVDLSRVRVRIDRIAEWRQGYDEAGRLMRDNYWREDMGGVDWAGVLDRYRPLLERLGGHDDFVDLLWEVQGELATSHADVQPGRRRRTAEPAGVARRRPRPRPGRHLAGRQGGAGEVLGPAGALTSVGARCRRAGG